MGGKPTFAVAALSAIVWLQGCFLFYDSRWGQAKQSQQHNAQHETPSALHATPSGDSDAAPSPAAPAAHRVLRVRVHTTARHAAEVVDWPGRLAEAIDDANAVLGPTLGIRLELVASSPWAPHASDDDLRALTDELAATDPGADVDRVIGLTGALPRFELSFHELGMGQFFGKHLVLRAMNDAREYEAIERSLPDIDEKERHRLHRERRRHKAASVLLHELGHTLGVPHELDRRSIMHPSYDVHEEGFSPAAADLMRLTLAHEVSRGSDSADVFARAVLDHLDRTSTAWVPAERDALRERMEHLRAAHPTQPPRPPSARPPPARPPAARSPRSFGTASPANAQPDGSAAPRASALSASDRSTLAQAKEHLRAGRSDEAARTAKPLFDAYPDDYDVADFRCQLAMKRGAPLKEVQAECAALLRLVPGAAPHSPP